MNKTIMFSSNTEMWETPATFFEKLDKIYNFHIDVCASSHNAKCDKFYSIQDDGLKQQWTGTCWMNPPYGREIGKWIKKASDEAKNHNAVIVALLPARTDTKWFHEYIYMKPGVSVEFIQGRIKFGDAKSGALSHQ